MLNLDYITPQCFVMMLYCTVSTFVVMDPQISSFLRSEACEERKAFSVIEVSMWSFVAVCNNGDGGVLKPGVHDWMNLLMTSMVDFRAKLRLVR